MIVYIEAVLFDNLAADLLLGELTLTIIKEKFGVLRIILFSLFSIVSCVLFIFLTGTYAILYKFFTLFASVFILKKYCSIREYVIALVLFSVCSFVLSGACGFIFNMKITAENLLFYEGNATIGLVCLGGIITIYAIKQLVSVIGKYRSIKNSGVILCINKKIYKLKALLDSGNKLIDERGKPVFVLSKKFEEGVKGLPFSYMQVSTAVGMDLLKTVRADYVKVLRGKKQQVINDVTVAVARTEFSDYQIILSDEANKEEEV